MLLTCAGCTARYAPDLAWCPQCGSRVVVEEGQEDMPKITRYGGASNAADLPPEPAVVVETPAAPDVDPAPEPQGVEVETPATPAKTRRTRGNR